MGFWQPLHLTHASREIPEHSSAKVPGKGTSSMLDTSSGDFTLWGEELFGGALFSHQMFAFSYLSDHPFQPSPFTPWPSLICLQLWLRIRRLTNDVTIINVPLQDPVLPVLSFLANDSAPLLFPLTAIDMHRCLYPKW